MRSRDPEKQMRSDQFVSVVFECPCHLNWHGYFRVVFDSVTWSAESAFGYIQLGV